MIDNSSLDDIDKEIIKHLQSDSRITLTFLSEKFNLTRNTIKYRIKNLEAKGFIIKYTTVLDPKKFGKKVTAIFNFNVPLDQITIFSNLLKKFENITNVYFTTGHYSICAMGIFDNHEDLNKFLIDQLSKTSIREYVVSTVLERYKEQFYELK
ncbi:MAG: Lrp/AsnC family transcriptional regulator [Candidatus Thorarchaeota archaeon]